MAPMKELLRQALQTLMELMLCFMAYLFKRTFRTHKKALARHHSWFDSLLVALIMIWKVRNVHNISIRAAPEMTTLIGGNSNVSAPPWVSTTARMAF